MFSFSVVSRVVIIALWLLVVSKFPSTHGGHLLSLVAGMAVLSLVTDERLKRWFVLPEPPTIMKVPDHDDASPDLECYVGLEEQFKEHFADILDEERILMAANRHKGTGQIWAVERPGRHHHVCWAMDMLNVPQEYRREMGFLTSYGRYVGRREAALIAVSSNQLLDQQHHPELLFSEDLWETPEWRSKDGSSPSYPDGVQANG